MANIHISEFSGLAAAPQGDDVVAASAAANLSNVSVLIDVAAAQLILKPTTSWVYITAGAPCAVRIAPGAIAQAGDLFLNTGQSIWVRVVPGLGYIVSWIQDTL